MSTEVATTEANGPPTPPTPAVIGGGALALSSDQTSWTKMQMAALAQLGLADAPEGDLMVFMHQCQRTGLDPFARQIYMIGRQEQGKTKYTIQTGIDGFRAVAEEHEQYLGQEDILWCGPDGAWTDVWLDDKNPPVAARCGVIRSDKRAPIRAVVLFREFAQTKTWQGQVSLTSMWKTKGAHMLGKCAEAGALRKAFPQRLSGIYTEDEAGAFERVPAERVESTRAPQSAVTSDELAGEPEPHADPAPTGEPVTHADDTGHPRMTADQSKKLFPLIRKAQVGDRNAWAGRILEREITTFGEVTEADADKLIENAALLVAAASEDATEDAEVVEEGPAS